MPGPLFFLGIPTGSGHIDYLFWRPSDASQALAFSPRRKVRSILCGEYMFALRSVVSGGVGYVYHVSHSP